MESSVVEIAGKQFELVKKGREQAEQVIQLGKWVNEYGVPALASMMNEEGEISFVSGFDLLGDILQNISVDALIDLYVVVIGCTKGFANKNFDIAVLIDTLAQVYDAQPSLGKVLSRFFSQGTSDEITEEPSTTSEQPTDG
jgi:hypothetical protein